MIKAMPNYCNLSKRTRSLAEALLLRITVFIAIKAEPGVVLLNVC